MIGLKIKDHWLQGILNRQKTMELRSLHRKLTGQVIALGNSDSKLVEGYAYVKEIIKIPQKDVSKYGSVHLASKADLKELGYDKKPFLYGYRLCGVRREAEPFPYVKSPSIWFKIEEE